MAFVYDEIRRAAFDEITRAQMKFSTKFLDTDVQPIEYSAPGEELSIDYEVDTATEPFVLPSGETVQRRCEVAVRLKDWQVKSEFVRGMRDVLPERLPRLVPLPEYCRYVQRSFLELERTGRTGVYEALKIHLIEGARVLWAEGGKFPAPTVTFMEWLPTSVTGAPA